MEEGSFQSIREIFEVLYINFLPKEVIREVVSCFLLRKKKVKGDLLRLGGFTI